MVDSLFTTIMDPVDHMELARRNDLANRKIESERPVKSDLDKDAFLNLLVTQLTHQDPLQPMEDKQFIAQMAQFSTLEQINNMSDGMGKMANELAGMTNMVSRNNALSLLGMVVEIDDNGMPVVGRVQQVSGGETHKLRVNGRFYDYDSVRSVGFDELLPVNPASVRTPKEDESGTGAPPHDTTIEETSESEGKEEA
mgnify:CR=1 FL=1